MTRNDDRNRKATEGYPVTWHFSGICVMAGMLCCLTSLAWGAEGRVAAANERPNIVLIVVDTLRADHLGCYGYQRPTSPNIDQLAAQGVLFENCYSPSSWTMPAFASMFTGYYPAVHGLLGRDDVLPPSMTTLTEELGSRGYYCAAVVSNPLLNAKYGYGRGFDLYDDYSVFLEAELALFAVGRESGQGGSVNDMVTGESVTAKAHLLLDRAVASGKPFFLFIHYFDPHDSYIPPAPYDRKFAPAYDGPMDGRNIRPLRHDSPDDQGLEHLKARYDGEIAYEDMLIGQLVKRIDEVADPANTIIIVTSDHGEAWAEHGVLLHGNSVYREEVWVPLIWRWPGRLPEGHRVTQPVSMMDIAATLRDLIGLDHMDDIQARSLVAMLHNRSDDRGVVLSERAYGKGHHIAVARDSRRLHARFETNIGDATTIYEAYDLSSDPFEQANLYVKLPEDFKDLKEALHDLWRQSKDIRFELNTDQPRAPIVLTEEERRRIEGLGYTEAR